MKMECTQIMATLFGLKKLTISEDEKNIHSAGCMIIQLYMMRLSSVQAALYQPELQGQQALSWQQVEVTIGYDKQHLEGNCFKNTY